MERDSVADHRRAVAVLECNWRPEHGYTSPNPDTYPWQWLWDSCFHAVVWAVLGDERALVELESVFRYQRPNGFVPHMNYTAQPEAARSLWGIDGSSTITQPPMYAHAAAVLARLGMEVPGPLLERIERALEHLWVVRRAEDGLLTCFHPWEIADDSPRWDDWTAAPFDRLGAWAARKRELVAALLLDDQGAAVGSREFLVQSAAFNGLAAFNMAEFAELTGRGEWERRSRALTTALEACWDPRLRTWVDTADPPRASARVRTLEALLPVLTAADQERRRAVWEELTDPQAFGAPFGPCGVHRAEPAFDPAGYWRGGAWPQLHYLLAVAARRYGRGDTASRLAATTAQVAREERYPEYWNPLTGEGLGASPQAWTTLWVAMEGEGADRGG